jgi:hypothetical protein
MWRHGHGHYCPRVLGAFMVVQYMVIRDTDAPSAFTRLPRGETRRCVGVAGAREGVCMLGHPNFF